MGSENENGIISGASLSSLLPSLPSSLPAMSIDQAAAEVRELIPRVLQALHANNVWESVKSAEEITSSQFEDQPRPYILILTRANTARK